MYNMEIVLSCMHACCIGFNISDEQVLNILLEHEMETRAAWSNKVRRHPTTILTRSISRYTYSKI